MRPDKEKVINEVWDDDRVRSFLFREAPAGETAKDFALLLTAYQGMRAEDFSRFIGYFVDAGHDVNATNRQGIRFVDHISRHRRAGPFVEAMTRAGAAAPAGTSSRRPE